MSTLLEIFGRGVLYDPADLLCHWLIQFQEQQSQKEHWESPLREDLIELIRNKRFESAQEELRICFFEDEIPVEVYVAGATVALYQNDLQQAIEDLESVYQRQPSNTIVLYCLGMCHERLHEDNKAIEYYQDCLKFKHRLELPAQRLAAIYLRQQRYEQAIAQYQLLKDACPEDLTVFLALGNLYIAKGDCKQAIDAFSRAIVLSPDSLSFQDHELDQYLQEQQFDEALSHIDGLLDLYPGRADLVTKRGDVLQFMGDIEQALSEYQQAITLSPGYIDAHIKLGSLCMRMQAFEKAAHQFNEAFELHERIIDAYIGLALAHRQNNEQDLALAALCSASMIQPNSSLLFFETARMLLMGMTDSGETIEADPQEATVGIFNAFKSRLEQDPQNPTNCYIFGLCQLYMSGPEQALTTFKCATQMHRSFPRANMKLAISLYAMGQSEEALSQLSNLFIHDRTSLDLHYRTAMLYGEPVKFAATMMNLSRMMATNWTDTDPSAQITVILQNLGILKNSEHILEHLKEILESALVSPNEDNEQDWF